MLRRLGLLFTLVGFGCGPVAGVGSSASDDGSTGTTGTAATTALTGSMDVTGAEGSEGGEAESGGPSVPGLCGAADGDQPLAVLASDTSAMLMRADGSMLVLDVGAESVPPNASPYFSIDARGPFVATALSWALVDDGVTHGSEVRLFDADGALLWHVSQPSSSLSGVRVGADGSVVATKAIDDGQYHGVLYQDGVPLALPDFTPQAEIRPDNTIPGRSLDGLGDTYGWLHVDELAFVPLSLQPIDNWVRFEDGAYVYVAAADPEPLLVRETLGQADVTALAGVQVPAGTIHISSRSSAKWLLLRGDDGAPWFRVSVDDAVVEPLELSPPPGFQWLECYSSDPVVDLAGGILLPTRDAVAGRMQRFDPSAGSWQTVGEAVTRIDTISAQVFGATTVVRSEAENTTFCPPQTFDPAPDLPQGATWQIVRPDNGVEIVLPGDIGWLGLRADGGCAAVLGSAPEQTTVLDVVHGDELAVAGTHSVSWWRDP